MDPFLARTMVENLSKGIHPLTGLPLYENDSCSNEAVQDALLEVLEHCAIESTEQYLLRLKEEKKEKSKAKQAENKKRYPNGGNPWTKEDETKMMSLHRSGYNIYQIANILKRTPNAIASHMKKLQSKKIYRHNK